MELVSENGDDVEYRMCVCVLKYVCVLTRALSPSTTDCAVRSNNMCYFWIYGVMVGKNILHKRY